MMKLWLYFQWELPPLDYDLDGKMEYFPKILWEVYFKQVNTLVAGKNWLKIYVIKNYKIKYFNG